MNVVKYSLKLSAIGGVFYLLLRYVIHQAGMDFSSAPDWLFRIVLVAFITGNIISVKAANHGYIGFTDAFRAGIWTTLFLAIFISLGTYVFCDYLSPTYTDGLEENYRAMHYNRMMRTYIGETWKKDTITPGAIDTIQRGLDLNVKNHVGSMFTTSGQVYISLMYSFFWGIVVSLTVSLLSRKSKDDF